MKIVWITKCKTKQLEFLKQGELLIPHVVVLCQK